MTIENNANRFTSLENLAEEEKEEHVGLQGAEVHSGLVATGKQILEELNKEGVETKPRSIRPKGQMSVKE